MLTCLLHFACVARWERLAYCSLGILLVLSACLLWLSLLLLLVLLSIQHCLPFGLLIVNGVVCLFVCLSFTALLVFCLLVVDGVACLFGQSWQRLICFLLTAFLFILPLLGGLFFHTVLPFCWQCCILFVSAFLWLLCISALRQLFCACKFLHVAIICLICILLAYFYV